MFVIDIFILFCHAAPDQPGLPGGHPRPAEEATPRPLHDPPPTGGEPPQRRRHPPPGSHAPETYR